MAVLRTVFLDRHSELRSGWRIVAFLLLFGIVALALIVPATALHIGSNGVTEGLIAVALLAASFIMTRFVNKKPFVAIGVSIHPAMLRELGMGCLLGFLMMSAIFATEISLGYVTVVWRGLPLWGALLALVSGCAVFATAAAAEELLFRGYLFQTLIQGITFLPAMLLMAALFALAHLANPHVTVLSTVNVGLAGIWFSFAYMKTRSLWLPFGLHFSWNFTQTTIYAFRTSGVAFGGRQLFVSVQSGPDWLTGGAFGPEGGVLATLMLLVCTSYILKTPRLAAPEGIITLDSLEDLLQPRNGSQG